VRTSYRPVCELGCRVAQSWATSSKDAISKGRLEHSWVQLQRLRRRRGARHRHADADHAVATLRLHPDAQGYERTHAAADTCAGVGPPGSHGPEPDRSRPYIRQALAPDRERRLASKFHQRCSHAPHEEVFAAPAHGRLWPHGRREVMSAITESLGG